MGGLRTRKVLPQWPQTTLIPSGWMGSAGWAGCSSGITITGLRLIIRLLWKEQREMDNLINPTCQRRDWWHQWWVLIGLIRLLLDCRLPTSLVEDILSSSTCLYRWAGSYRDTSHISSLLGGFWWAGRQHWQNEMQKTREKGIKKKSSWFKMWLRWHRRAFRAECNRV